MHISVQILAIIVDIFISYFENYLLISMLELFFSRKKSNKYFLIGIITILSYFVNTYMQPIYSSFILIAILYLYEYFFLKGNKLLLVCIPIALYINLFVISVSSSIVHYLLGNEFYNFIDIHSLDYFLLSFFSKGLLFLEYVLMKKYMSRDLYISKKTWALSIILIISAVIVPLVLLSEYIADNIDSLLLVCMSILSFILISLMSYLLLMNSNKDHKRIIEQQIYIESNKHEEKLITLIQEKIEEVNSLKHDLNNHKNILYNINNNQESLLYIDELFKDLDVIKTNNQILNYLINDKFKAAKLQNVDMKCMLQGDFKNTISMVDFSVILGNLLDNAIEAAVKTDERYIDLNITQNDFSLIIKISNTFRNINFKNGYYQSTKEDNNHGYGLSNIKKICEKYHGEDIIDIKNNLFIHTCILLLPDWH